jgi:pimeloyl-ACP methyl ester carboxylesterase
MKGPVPVLVPPVNDMKSKMPSVMQPRTVTAFGAEVHYLTGGQGPPLLLIHGIGESNNSWSYNYDALARHFRIYAPDLVGWGQTTPSPAYHHDLSGLADFILAFMDAVGLDRTFVVGWSLGGAATIAAAVRAPERFPRVMLLAPAGLGRKVHWLFRAVHLPLLGEMMLMPIMLTVRTLYQLLYAHDWRKVSRDFLVRARDKARQPWHRSSTLAFVRAHHALTQGQGGLDMRSQLHRLSMPVRILWGRQDRVLSVIEGQAALGLLPQGSLVVLDECGHMPMLEQTDRFHDEVLGFFTP